MPAASFRNSLYTGPLTSASGASPCLPCHSLSPHLPSLYSTHGEGWANADWLSGAPLPSGLQWSSTNRDAWWKEDHREGREWGWGSYSPGSFSAASGWLCPLKESHTGSQGSSVHDSDSQILAATPTLPCRLRKGPSFSNFIIPHTLHIPLWVVPLLTTCQL